MTKIRNSNSLHINGVTKIRNSNTLHINVYWLCRQQQSNFIRVAVNIFPEIVAHPSIHLARLNVLIAGRPLDRV